MRTAGGTGLPLPVTGWGGGEGAVAFSLFSGLSCVSPNFSDGYMWLAKLDLEINARYCISICM